MRHLLTHTGGVRMLDTGWPAAGWDAIVARVCAQRLEPRWEPGRKAGYHLASSWFILGELIHRLDGRRFETYVREEIFAPLGANDCWIGMPAERFHDYGARIAPMFDVGRVRARDRLASRRTPLLTPARRPRLPAPGGSPTRATERGSTRRAVARGKRLRPAPRACPPLPDAARRRQLRRPATAPPRDRRGALGAASGRHDRRDVSRPARLGPRGHRQLRALRRAGDALRLRAVRRTARLRSQRRAQLDGIRRSRSRAWSWRWRSTECRPTTRTARRFERLTTFALSGSRIRPPAGSDVD